MSLPGFFKKVRLSQLLLWAWLLFCLGWAVAGRKPWQTIAFDEELGVKKIPVREYAAAGLWIGLLVSGTMAAGLLALRRWWGRPEAAPVLPAGPGGERLAGRWFWLAVLGIAGFALWQRWPGMTLGFWGDEGWMFCDFVHGKWFPAVKGGSLQESLRFSQVSWEQAFFGDFSGNNHWLATHLQRLALKSWQAAAQQPAWAFEEWVIRLVPLAAGLAALAALAGWLRWLGRPVAGLVAAVFLAVHPWHMRFSLEVRGYSLMLLFFILTLWAMSKALREGRLRDWLVFGMMQFLMMYSWKGGVYALMAVNVVLGVRLLRGTMPDISLRRVALGRWLAAGLLGALLFVPLVMPSQLQMRKSIEEVRRRAKPMEAEWRHNLAAETLTGMPWHEQEAANPKEVSLQRLLRESRAATPALGALILLVVFGYSRLWGQDRFLAWICVAVLASGGVAAVHFKFGLRVELLTWYLLYNLPVLALLFAVAVTPRPGRAPRPALVPGWGLAGAAALTGFAALGLTQVRDMQFHPRENLKLAWRMTRGQHEPVGFKVSSKIYTGWLWRHTDAYDARADMYVRTPETLDAKMNLARQSGAEFYMIVGIRDLSELICGDVMKALKNPALFDHLGTLWGVEALNTLDVYRMRKAAVPPE
jgi:Dolichyl-phosphate-mannose-protein mannosyltransferase